MAFKVQVKVIVPKEILNVQNVADEIARTQRERSAPDLTRLFKQTTEGWKSPPDFSRKQRISPSEISIAVFASGNNADKYTLVNEGSPKHPIPLRPGKMLRFQEGYRASTKPRILKSTASVRSGRWVSFLTVNHPGFEPREFDETIAKHYEKVFQRDMQAAINRGAK